MLNPTTSEKKITTQITESGLLKSLVNHPPLSLLLPSPTFTTVQLDWKDVVEKTQNFPQFPLISITRRYQGRLAPSSSSAPSSSWSYPPLPGHHCLSFCSLPTPSQLPCRPNWLKVPRGLPLPANPSGTSEEHAVDRAQHQDPKRG